MRQHSTVMLPALPSPVQMRDAGVPIEDALWLVRQAGRRARRALVKTIRGQAILVRVRSCTQRNMVSAQPIPP